MLSAEQAEEWIDEMKTKSLDIKAEMEAARRAQEEELHKKLSQNKISQLMETVMFQLDFIWNYLHYLFCHVHLAHTHDSCAFFQQRLPWIFINCGVVVFFFSLNQGHDININYSPLSTFNTCLNLWTYTNHQVDLQAGNEHQQEIKQIACNIQNNSSLALSGLIPNELIINFTLTN